MNKDILTIFTQIKWLSVIRFSEIGSLYTKLLIVKKKKKLTCLANTEDGFREIYMILHHQFIIKIGIANKF